MYVYESEPEFLNSPVVQERVAPPHYVAMVLAERVMTQAPRDSEFKETDAVADCTATFGFVASLARLNRFPMSSLEELESRWVTVQERTTKANVRNSSEPILAFWNLIELVESSGGARAAGPLGELLEAARSYASTGKIDAFYWDALTRTLPEIRVLPSQLNSVKEQQVEPLTRAVRVLIEAQHVNRTVREFLAGFLVSEFANHSFDYLQMAVGLLRPIPLAVFWFAVLASLSHDNNILEFSAGFGRFVRARMSAEAAIAPRADIAFHELLAAKTCLREMHCGMRLKANYSLNFLGASSHVRDLAL